MSGLTLPVAVTRGRHQKPTPNHAKCSIVTLFLRLFLRYLTVMLKHGLGVTRGHRNWHGRSAAYDFLLTFHSSHGLSHTVSNLNGNCSRKIANFSHPRVFCAPAEGVPFKFCISTMGQKTRMMGLHGRERSLTISLANLIQCMNVKNRWTLGDSKDCAYA